MKHYSIEAWNQPQGSGNGWARCTANKAERFFVFNRGDEPRGLDRLNGRSFATKEDARAAIAKAEGK
jgi:hypothetical protein